MGLPILSPMPRFFFHIRGGDLFEIDPDGLEFASIEYAVLDGWAEEVTNVSQIHASDAAYAAAAGVFEPKDLVDLTITIAGMNAFNRLGAQFRLPVPAKA